MDANNVTKFLKEVEGKSIDELVAVGREKLASMPAGGGATPSGGGGGGGGAAAAAEEEKKVEEESEEEVRRRPLAQLLSASQRPFEAVHGACLEMS